MESNKLSQDITRYFLTKPSLMQMSTSGLWILFLYIHIKNELQKKRLSICQFNFI